MGDDVSCDCGHSNDFSDDEIAALEGAAAEDEDDECDWT